MLGVQRFGDGFEEERLLWKAVHETSIGGDSYLRVRGAVEAELLQFSYALDENFSKINR